MHPQEKRAFGMLVEPCQRTRQHLIAGALNGVVAALLTHILGVEIGVVRVEAALETGGPAFRVKSQRAQECRSVISMASQNLGSIGQILGQHHREINRSVELGIRPRENGRVGHGREWSLRIGARENRRLPRSEEHTSELQSPMYL